MNQFSLDLQFNSRTYVQTEAGYYIPYAEEKFIWPWKYRRKKLKRQFKSANNNVCRVKKKYYNYIKLSPEEKAIRKQCSKDKKKAADKLNRPVRRLKLRLQAPWEMPIKGAKARAKEHNLPFDLDNEWGKATYTGLCSLTGLPFVFIKGKRNLRSASIDKIIPELGYIKSNCRWVLLSINMFKNNGTDAEMLETAQCLLNNVNFKK